MTYAYEHRSATAADEGVAKVADVYVVRGVEAEAGGHPGPSPELLAAVKRLSPEVQALVHRLIEVGFQAVVRK